MARSILRNIQNSLVIMSLVLCILAFQRLESLDVVHKASPPSSTWPYPPPYTERFSEDDSRDSKPSLLQLVFGRDIPLRWFFVSELWKRHGPTNAMPPAISWNDSFITQSKHLRGSYELTHKSTLSAERKREQVAILVSLDSCEDKNNLEAVAVLQQSLSGLPGNFRLHILVTTPGGALSQCQNVMPDGHELISMDWIGPSIDKEDVSCLTLEQKILLFAHSLEDFDTVAYLALPSIAFPANSITQDEAKDAKHSIDDEPKRNNEKSPFSSLMIRPKGKQAVERLAKLCHDKEATQELVESLVPWQSCSGNSGHSCRLTKAVSIETFDDCPLPWINVNENKVKLDSKMPSKCQYLEKKWLEAKDDMTQSKQNMINVQSA